MEGKIIKGIAGFYYVDVAESGIYECKAKGGFRKQHIKPLIGDQVVIEVSDYEENIGTIIEVLPRKSSLIRPEVANVDQILLIFALSNPKPNIRLLDSFLVMLEEKRIPVVLLFNKEDLVLGKETDGLPELYENVGYKVFVTSVKNQGGLDLLTKSLKGKTTALAGPSGVGKSSLMNYLLPEASMEVGEVSKKIARGKHTTRHAEIFRLDNDTFIMDTPGFTSLRLEDVTTDSLKYDFLDFMGYNDKCRFSGCSHIHEPECAVKKAVEEGKIDESRYESYVGIYEELKERRKF
ncbi:MAG: ribosome small subunit-dependent GTPase A [Lachnospiraceae bacterium]|nr:ribosome small subunit-dependent GTPase A [Lachnospiraceae bacterium]